MTVQVFPSGPLATNAYVLTCPETRKAAIIDPSPGSADAIFPFLEKNALVPTHILLTHSHWDHIADAASLKEQYRIPVYVHPSDAGNLLNPGSDRIHCRISIQPIEVYKTLAEGDHLTIGNLKLTVIHTPGHTPGGVCFYLPAHHILFSGDTLFKGTIGNLALPTAQADLMWGSLKKLAILPPETKVYSGHGPATIIGSEHWLKDAENIFT